MAETITHSSAPHAAGADVRTPVEFLNSTETIRRSTQHEPTQNWAYLVTACAAVTAAIVASRTAFVLHARTRISDHADQARKERAEARQEWKAFLAAVVDALEVAARDVTTSRRKSNPELNYRVQEKCANYPGPLAEAMKEVIKTKAHGDLAGPVAWSGRPRN